MTETMTIGELANRAGVAGSTVRYYERRGLLRPAGRTEANYRIYGPESVARLQFIRAAQTSGLSLDDIRTLLGFSDGAVAPCEEVQAVIDTRLEHVRRQVKDLRRIQRALERLHDACGSSDRRGPCPAIEEFRGD
jgi:DNA-binding transcriptional MerR regulator